MRLNFEVKPRQIINPFAFGNIESNYGVNSVYFTKDGKPFVPVSGEFHFSRYNNAEWKNELLKMKASGLNAVATYIFWIHHEYNKGEYDFSGDRDIKKFLSICKEIDMPCILRIGPWAHGECIYGGFPKYVQKLAAKRCDSPKYLSYVKAFWTRLYQEVKDYCDGKVILGIQLENEYGGSIKHIHTLKKIAEEIGFKTPFFTMTAWPTNTPDNEILPTFGGYPEAPWTQNKNPLAPKGRFAICEGRTEVEIGEDLIKTKTREKASFSDMPYAGCEVGTGNQVTQHRRPVINDKDGYGVAFAKFASGMNWMGYYMYHGGRNPVGQLYQENRLTLYPNNYPIIDYDFQAPLSKDGVLREHGKRLRLMHTFIANWDSDIAKKQAYFASKGNNATYPYCSVRCDENMSGYLFLSNYERGEKNTDIDDINVCVKNCSQSLEIKGISVPAGAMYFLPFNFEVENTKVDYIFAQPVAKVKNVWYFAECEGLKPAICVDGKINEIDGEYKIGKTTLKVLDSKEAKAFYLFDGKVYNYDGVLYKGSNGVVKEAEQKADNHKFVLNTTSKVKLPYDYYLYSYSKRHYYELVLDKELIKNHYDVTVKIKFEGLNLQVFSGKQLIDDYFNTDGVYELHFKNLKRYLGDEDKLIIKAVAATSIGVGNVYNEIDIPTKKVSLDIIDVSTTDIENIN